MKSLDVLSPLWDSKLQKPPLLRRWFLIEIILAGMEGFEPPNARTKTWCLTTWRHPNMLPSNFLGNRDDFNLFSGNIQC